MAGDSLYQAWFKAHHTAKFYEISIGHYQDKNKKDKIDALVKEAMKSFDFKLGDYEFGTDNRKVNVDEKTKTIYPNLSSVKGFGEGMVNTLYEFGKKEYINFIEVLKDLESNSVNKTIIDKLIKINYFKKFSSVNKLLKITEYYNLLDGAKQLSKDKIMKNGLDMEIVKKYGNETVKQINKLDSSSLLNELIETIHERELTLKERLDNQFDVLGIITYVDPSVNKKLYYVSMLDVKKSIVNMELYEIYSGTIRTLKIWTRQFDYKPFAEKDIINIHTIEKKNKREFNGQIDQNTGKKIYVEIPDKFEFWLKNYSIQGREEQNYYDYQ